MSDKSINHQVIPNNDFYSNSRSKIESEAIANIFCNKFISLTITEHKRRVIYSYIPQYCNEVIKSHLDDILNMIYILSDKYKINEEDNNQNNQIRNFNLDEENILIDRKIEYNFMLKNDSWDEINPPIHSIIDNHASTFIKYIPISNKNKETIGEINEDSFNEQKKKLKNKISFSKKKIAKINLPLKNETKLLEQNINNKEYELELNNQKEKDLELKNNHIQIKINKNNSDTKNIGIDKDTSIFKSNYPSKKLSFSEYNSIEFEQIPDEDEEIRKIRSRVEFELKKKEEDYKFKQIEKDKKEQIKQIKKEKEVDGKKITFDHDGKPILIKAVPYEKLPNDFISTNSNICELNREINQKENDNYNHLIKINAKVLNINDKILQKSEENLKLNSILKTTNIERKNQNLSNKKQKKIDIIFIGGKENNINNKQNEELGRQTQYNNRLLTNQPGGSNFE